MKLDVWCDSPDALRGISTLYADDKGGGEMKLASLRPHGGFLLITIDGVNSIESAMKYKGKELFARRGDIPKADGAFFIADLIGLSVYDAESGAVLGRVSDIFNRGASDIMEITRDDGNEILVPMINEFMAKIDPEDGIYINVVKGLLD